MKSGSLFITLFLLISCGQNSNKASPSSPSLQSCTQNGTESDCRSIQSGEGQGIDLLESLIDVPIKIQDSQITFMSNKSATSVGKRVTCKTEVKNGEVYRFTLTGNKLLIMSESGSYEMDRVNEGDSILGTWVWSGQENEGVYIIRQMTFLNDSRLIMKTNCEL